MKPYWAILRARCLLLLQYRAAAFAGFVTQFFWGLMRVMIFAAFYHSTTHAQPMSFAQVRTYVWLGQALLVLIPWNLDAEVAAMIRTGNVAYELLRPLDLYAFWYCRALALRTAPGLMRALPMFIIAGLFFGLQPPPSWAAVGAFVAAMLGAVLLSSAITTLLTLTTLWTVAGDGVQYLFFSGAMLLSGMVIPLPLFPAWAQPILAALPFRGLIDAPFRLYNGGLPPSELGWILAHQLLWTAAFVLIGRLALARGVRRLVIQGG